MLRYLELKTGFNGNGPAWVARVKLSKTGRTVYFNGMALKRSGGRWYRGGNEGMQQTKPAFFLDFAGFAADAQCSADRIRVTLRRE